MDLETGIDGTVRSGIDHFRPPLGWTHRLHVYTAVDDNFEIVPIVSASGDEPHLLRYRP